MIYLTFIISRMNQIIIKVIQEQAIYNVGVVMIHINEKSYFPISHVVLSIHIFSGNTSH